MKRFLLLSAIMFTLAAVRAQDVAYVVHHYSTQDGLSQNTVMSIIQDREGYMWFGTWDGLNKFDGYSFLTYKPHAGDKEQMRNNRVDFIYEDSLGYIWFQTYDNMLHRFDKSTEQFYTLPIRVKKLTSKLGKYFIEPCRGQLWVISEEGVIALSEGETGDVATTVYPQGGNASFVVRDGKGGVWFDTSTGLCCVLSGALQDYVLPDTEGLEITLSTACATDEGLWLGSVLGQVWYYTLQTDRFKAISSDLKAEIVDIKALNSQTMFFATEGAGFFVYNISDSSLKQYCKANTAQIESDDFRSINIDSNGTFVWLENNQEGVFRYRVADGNLKHLSAEIDKRYMRQLGPNFIILEDSEQRVWINPQGGGFSRYNTKADRLEFPVNGVTNMIHTAFIDNRGSLWLGTYDRGIDRIDEVKQQFHLQDLMGESNHSGEVRATLQLSDGSVIIASKDATLRLHDAATDQTYTLAMKEMVYSMYEDSHSTIWLGTRNKGLIETRKEGNQLTIANTYSHSDDIESISSNAIYDIKEDALGRLWIATYGGGINLKTGNSFKHFANELDNYPIEECSKVRELLPLGDSILLAATTEGLLKYDIKNNEFVLTPYYDTHCLLQDGDKGVWVGTFGGGLNKIIGFDEAGRAQFETYTSSNGLNSDIVLSMVEDQNGYIWFSSEETITRYDSKNGTFQQFKPFLESQNNFFTEASAVRLLTGKLIFGYNDGYCLFNPQQIERSGSIPIIDFTGFLLSNQNMTPQMPNSPLTQSISTTESIVLEHDQSVFSIEYAALDFIGAEQIMYAFLLDGFEKEWNYVGHQRKATYTNLPAGTYRFIVRSTNAEGEWVSNDKSLTIRVKPSFWQTGWAWVIYIAILIILIALIYLIVARHNRIQQQIKMENQMNEFRLRFFTNISHELRTPLTLISAPVENVLQNEKISPSVRTQLEIVASNAKRMLRLINEILDFRKIQNKKMRLRVQATNLAQLVSDTCQNFNKEAYDKNIHFHIVNKIPDQEVWVDREKADIILYNLLSNAFKFTGADKTITVQVSDKQDFILIEVIDEGVGIPMDKRNILFERFASHDQIENLAGKAGTGIGLNLVKELVDLHHGYIEVTSEEGKGSTFTVMLRKGKNHFGSDVDFLSDDTQTNSVVDTTANRIDQIIESQQLRNLLIVEDNEDMRAFLSKLFNNKFNIVTATDGVEGKDKAIENMPDIIISDLMMPNCDGLEMTEQLKTDERTSHIPVVLLTAKASIEDRLKAMEFGADDYITKPFSAEYLIARIDNILAQRDRLQESYRKNLMNLQPNKKSKPTPNETFLARLMDFMEKNMDNNELLVEDMVNAMALGRTVFFNKLKGLTGLSPVEFIREVRIKRAAQLLETTTYNVTEVTYMVGMNDSRYFSKCFKAVYGMTPTEYKKSVSK